MEKYPDHVILEGIRQDDTVIFNYIYARWLPMVEKMIINLGGRQATAKDIFQDTLIVIHRKIQSEDFTLSCKFSTYLYSISKKLYIQEIKSARNKYTISGRIPDMVSESDDNSELDKEIHTLFDRHFNDLSTDCQKILRLHFNGATIEEIRNIMNYKSSHHTMDRKYRCKCSLLKRISNDPKFKELKNELIRKNRFIY